VHSQVTYSEQMLACVQKMHVVFSEEITFSSPRTLRSFILKYISNITKFQKLLKIFKVETKKTLNKCKNYLENLS
jgi:hypothetical protein